METEGADLSLVASISLQPLCCATTVHKSENQPAAVWSFLAPACGRLWGALHSKHLNLWCVMGTHGAWQ